MIVASKRMVAVLLAAGISIAACATDGPDVRTGAVSQHTSVDTSPSVSNAEPTTTTSTTSSTTTSPRTSTTGGPSDPTATSTTGSAAPPAGQSGVGDNLFPDLGNPGLDVTHYDIDLAYDPASALLTGTVRLSITATTKLEHFTLDSVELGVTDVTVNGAAATFTVADPELWITPRTPLAQGDKFETVVAYSVRPAPSASLVGISNGWFPTATGSYTIDEPDGTRTWMPSNDHPSDKASYHFTILVPAGLTAVANGTLETHSTTAAGDVWVWDQPAPMATYLLQVITGPYDLIEGVGPNGLTLSSAVLTTDRALMQPFVDVTADQIDFFDNYFGHYPFRSYGIAVTDSRGGLAMEQQTRSLFSHSDFLSGNLGYTEQLLLSHELAHQWFGDAVSPARWQDIWLAESFATYAQWMWLEHVGLDSVTEEASRNLRGRQNGDASTATPSVSNLFGFEVYEGGAVVLHALRLTVGDDLFFSILQRWVTDYAGTSRTTEDFTALAGKVSGRDLTPFFRDWLYAADLPLSLPG